MFPEFLLYLVFPFYFFFPAILLSEQRLHLSQAFSHYLQFSSAEGGEISVLSLPASHQAASQCSNYFLHPYAASGAVFSLFRAYAR